MGNELEMTELQRRDLEQTAKYGHCWLVRRRAQALLLLGQGRTPAEVADILDTRRENIYQWRMNWRQGGMAGLTEGRHTGRPGALNEEQLADAGTYSIRQLMTLMQVRYPGFGVHPSTMRRILRERGFRWKRTRYSLKKRSQPAYQQASEELAGLARWRERGLEFYFLPPYSPELNRIEGLWRQVKYHWYPFREADASELESRIARILDARGDAYARNLTY